MATTQSPKHPSFGWGAFVYQKIMSTDVKRYAKAGKDTMSKLRHIGLQFFADPATPPAEPPATPPAQTPGTPPTAGTVDIEAITAQAAKKAEEAAEKKMEGVFKSMLEQQGLDAETITKMTAEWKSKQRTPETVAAELTAANEILKAENATVKSQMLAVSKGIPADKADKYIALAKAYPDAEKDFGKALDAALVDFPIEKKPLPPHYAAGTGSTPMLGDPPAGLAAFQKDINKHRIIK